ncbi:hypothetical protein GCM10012280_69410 [Wenjunlia tyrosinilytica]|uniref:Uncharacterized protein n=1 Tax=Wenjunlia tyrosinilytica TaxID=1544741 RepID=A0A918E2X4_9ACTN|nr:hypothetical protein GCM10012280_69410 [Wenjunlia tyrosinilytica]
MVPWSKLCCCPVSGADPQGTRPTPLAGSAGVAADVLTQRLQRRAALRKERVEQMPDMRRVMCNQQRRFVAGRGGTFR